MKETTTHSQAHATFVIERTYPVPVTVVWHALSDGAARDQWFTAGDAFATHDKQHDFRVGGQSTETGQWHGGPLSRFHATSSSRSASCSPTTCGSTNGTCPRP